MGNKTYDQLSMRQKGLVDAIALTQVENEDLSSKEIVELAHEMSGEEKYVPGYVSNFEENYEDAIEERVQLLANERNEEEGEVVTIGDPFRSYTGPEEGIDATMQNIKERPVKSTETDTEEQKITLTLSEEKIFCIIRQVDKDVAKEIFDQL